MVVYRPIWSHSNQDLNLDDFEVIKRNENLFFLRKYKFKKKKLCKTEAEREREERMLDWLKSKGKIHILPSF